MASDEEAGVVQQQRPRERAASERNVKIAGKKKKEAKIYIEIAQCGRK